MNTLTIELPEDLAGWLRDRAAKTGLTQQEIVQAQLAKAHREDAENPWAKYAGVIEGPPDLSTREGFGPR